ncbi:MAG: phytanoyl-CoA dioxygenase family protein, partial [Caldilineaceae bacterium SB0668_bin_21]|nr:phytanoyl-CoA dioxygenase family protein [Caldilineaceae bacterium SB0668_bin_21]
MLTRQQIDFYHENGYLGVEGVLSADEVADLRRVTDEFVQLSA